MIEKISRVPLREVWHHEALDFTTWLEDNIDVINDVLDLDLANVEREKNAGTFNVDLVAEDEKGNPVIIENQLEKSNHDHLGKVITYLTMLGAKTAIWIVSDPRPEHITAFSWLNESSAARFFLLKVEAIRIGDSSTAPLLTPIVFPTEEISQVGKTKKDFADRQNKFSRFWSMHLENAKQKTKLHAGSSPGTNTWVQTSAGVRGCSYVYVIRQHQTNIELYIDRGKDCGSENLAILNQLRENKEEIEQSFGDSLEWQELENRRACRIRKIIRLGGYTDPEERWPAIQEAMIEAMIRFERALAPYMKGLTI